ncbi:MAG TPA: type II toxin-antitoxin system RelE/ParE family toxin [Rhodopila sp.]|nr:type II toxin-antitoxin system RelE/ParE family toxin [Rhodopila sp.]
MKAAALLSRGEHLTPEVHNFTFDVNRKDTYMIGSWHDTDTEDVFKGGKGHRAWHSFVKVARRKLLMIEAARSKDDLRNPPGNRLEELKGNKRKGQYSIRINDQYRVCFTWPGDGKAYDIEITDYHDE